MPRFIKISLAVLSAILIVFLLVFLGLEIRNRYKAPLSIANAASIVMSAEGKVTANPDTASANFTVVTQGETASKVQEESDKKMKVVVDYLKSQGIKEEDIKTSSYNLFPQYDYSNSKLPETIIGYTINQGVTVKIRKLDTANEIVGKLTTKGVNQIDGLSFFIDDTDQLKAEARQQAIDKAKSKAEDLAKTLGVKLGRIINFTETDETTPVPYNYEMGGAGGRGGGESPIQPGSQDVTLTVSLTFELK